MLFPFNIINRKQFQKTFREEKISWLSLNSSGLRESEEGDMNHNRKKMDLRTSLQSTKMYSFIL